jgi:hypothetical protein
MGTYSAWSHCGQTRCACSSTSPPEKVKAVELKIGGAPTDLLVEALGQMASAGLTKREYKSAPNPHTVRLEFPQAVEASYFNLVIHNTEDQEPLTCTSGDHFSGKMMPSNSTSVPRPRSSSSC